MKNLQKIPLKTKEKEEMSEEYLKFPMYFFTKKNEKLCKLIFFIINKKYFNENPKTNKQNKINK